MNKLRLEPTQEGSSCNRTLIIGTHAPEASQRRRQAPGGGPWLSAEQLLGQRNAASPPNGARGQPRPAAPDPPGSSLAEAAQLEPFAPTQVPVSAGQRPESCPRARRSPSPSATAPGQDEPSAPPSAPPSRGAPQIAPAHPAPHPLRFPLPGRGLYSPRQPGRGRRGSAHRGQGGDRAGGERRDPRPPLTGAAATPAREGADSPRCAGARPAAHAHRAAGGTASSPASSFFFSFFF